MSKEIINGKIDNTVLGYEDHGIFTFSIGIDMGGLYQGFGGYPLDCKQHKPDDIRPGTSYGMEVIIRIVRAVGVDSWEKLKGSYCRVCRKDGMLVAIGHIVEDKWFDIKEFSEAWERGERIPA